MTSDLHGHYPETPGGDLLIVAGDLTARHRDKEFNEFFEWLYHQPYSKKILVAGNHDEYLERTNTNHILRRIAGYDKDDIEFEYLNDSAIELNGLKIWGTPWSKYFDGINPDCAAFMRTDRELVHYYAKIPNDIDILISHGPAYGILDESIYDQELCGSVALREAIERVKPRLFICGHIHEGFGYLLLKHDGLNTDCYNVSHMNVHYKPVNPVVNIEI